MASLLSALGAVGSVVVRFFYAFRGGPNPALPLVTEVGRQIGTGRRTAEVGALESSLLCRTEFLRCLIIAIAKFEIQNTDT